MSQETIDRITHVVDEFDRRVKAAGTDKWGKGSPCEEWTARDVVAHVTKNLNSIRFGLQGQKAPEIAADADIAQAWASARDGFLGALKTADLGQTIPGPLGPMPADQLIGRIIATDVLVHTWDLARATGGDERLDADAVKGSHEGLKPLDAMIRAPGVMGPKIERAEGADARTQFLNFLGRNV